MQEPPKANIKPIVGLGSPILTEECYVVDNTPDDNQVLFDLIATLNSLPSAVGLAAPQINSRLQAFVMKQGSRVISVINPVIIKTDLAQTNKEGCLSIPGISENVKRPDKIDVEYYDINFNKVRQKLRGFAAAIFQHEYDHLHGILYIDRLDKAKREEIEYKLNSVITGGYKSYYDMIFPDSPHFNNTNV